MWKPTLGDDKMTLLTRYRKQKGHLFEGQRKELGNPPCLSAGRNPLWGMRRCLGGQAIGSKKYNFLKVKERLKLIVLKPGKAEKGLGSSKWHF